MSGDKRSVDDLLDVLHRRADVRPTCGRKGLVQPVEVVGRVDANSRELQSGFEGRRAEGFGWGDFELTGTCSRPVKAKRLEEIPFPEEETHIGHHIEN